MPTAPVTTDPAASDRDAWTAQYMGLRWPSTRSDRHPRPVHDAERDLQAAALPAGVGADGPVGEAAYRAGG
jgi:hypothetical protein